jgi:hypothetical protein
MMAYSAGLTDYQYESLADPRTYIRLLQICSIDECRDVPVHCKLTLWAFDAAPAYTAISYTWGDPNLLELILVDGRTMEVRQNCGSVLRQAWQLKGSGYIWIDAICINQTDNDEKSPQVAMMGSVYKKAVQTLACVGRHENDSEFLCNMLHKKSHWWSQNAYGPLWFRFRRFYSWVLLRNSTKARLLKAFNLFLGRQYFRRVWIYQELFFGRDIQVCCGNENVQIAALWQLHAALSLWEKLPRMMLRCSHADLGDFPDQLLRTWFLLQAGVNRWNKGLLWNVMLDISSLQCEDPRDRVYGTLAVIDWEGTQPVEPDYSIDRFDLAVEVLRKLNRSSNFSFRLWEASDVAENLLLREEPSDKLNDAIQERLLLSPANIMIINPKRQDEGFGQSVIVAWGTRLLFNDATWKLSRNIQTSAAGRSGLRLQRASDAYKQGVFPTIKQWSKRCPLDSAEADILLPQDAQRKDWLLVPSMSRGNDDKNEYCTGDFTPAFLAREVGKHQVRILSKVLIFPQRLWPRSGVWEKFCGNDTESVRYEAHIDSEDILLLTHSCNWTVDSEASAASREARRQLAEKYFETRLCGAESCPYAVLMDF